MKTNDQVQEQPYVSRIKEYHELLKPKNYERLPDFKSIDRFKRLSHEDIENAIDSWDVKYDSRNEKDSKDNSYYFLHNLMSCESKSLAKRVLTTHEERERFLKQIENYDRSDFATFEKMEDILYVSRIRKQRENWVTTKELHNAIQTEDEEVLRNIFMTDAIGSISYYEINKKSFAKSYFKLLKKYRYSDRVISFEDICRESTKNWLQRLIG